MFCPNIIQIFPVVVCSDLITRQAIHQTPGGAHEVGSGVARVGRGRKRGKKEAGGRRRRRRRRGICVHARPEGSMRACVRGCVGACVRAL